MTELFTISSFLLSRSLHIERRHRKLQRSWTICICKASNATRDFGKIVHFKHRSQAEAKRQRDAENEGKWAFSSTSYIIVHPEFLHENMVDS